jgi:hypothetical protein
MIIFIAQDENKSSTIFIARVRIIEFITNVYIFLTLQFEGLSLQFCILAEERCPSRQ